jgi:hypothetical protein
MNKYKNYTSYLMDIQKHNVNKRQQIKQISEELFEKVNPQHKKAFDYVYSLFPDVDVRNVTIYQCNLSRFKKILGKTANGFYLIYQKVVIISDDCKEFCNTNQIKDVQYTTDEVIVHELIHFVSHSGGMMSSELLEEELAYGNSIGYFRQKGYSDDDIINKKLTVYLSMVIPKDIKNKIIYDSLIEKKYSAKEYESFTLDKKKRILKSINDTLDKNMKKEIYVLGKEFLKSKNKDSLKIIIPQNEEKDSPFSTIDL